jgi:hypothetical protein
VRLYIVANNTPQSAATQTNHKNHLNHPKITVQTMPQTITSISKIILKSQFRPPPQALN